jgi:FkbM family methyltransferase
MGLFDIVRFIVQHPVGGRAPVAALRRFAAWQIASRTSPGAIAVPFIGDSRLLVLRGMTGATGNVYVGLHEFEEMALVLHALRAQDLFIDVGANIGAYTVLAAKVVGCQCLAVEPMAGTARKLRDNLALNEIGGRVELHECAVGEHEGRVPMIEADTVSRVVSAQVAGAIEVPLLTLDGLVDQRAAVLMKMDVEGYELAALRGARKLLSNPALLACIVETLRDDRNGNHDADPVVALLRDSGFQPANYDPRRRALTAREGINAAGNTVFVRGWEALEERVRTADPFEVLGQRI